MSTLKNDSLLLPVRPSTPIDEDSVDGPDPAFERTEDSGVVVAKDDERFDSDELVCSPCDDDGSVVRPQLLPCPKAPSARTLRNTMLRICRIGTGAPGASQDAATTLTIENLVLGRHGPNPVCI